MKKIIFTPPEGKTLEEKFSMDGFPSDKDEPNIGMTGHGFSCGNIPQ